MTTSLANDFAVVRLKKKKSEGTFYYSYISGDEFFFDGFSLIPKSRRRGKLQSLRLHINSKTKGPACNYFVPDGIRTFTICDARRTSLCARPATHTYSHTHDCATTAHECLTAHIYSRTQVFTQKTHLPAHVQAHASMRAHIGWRSCTSCCMQIFEHEMVRAFITSIACVIHARI